jgi:poly(3-hydroxyalkanoate) synthetase
LLITPNQVQISNSKEQLPKQEPSQQQQQKQIDLRNITAPLLMIDAEKDDLVTTDSALALSSHISSKKKKTMINPGGHVALCISDAAHKKLWPEVAEWILSN